MRAAALPGRSSWVTGREPEPEIEYTLHSYLEMPPYIFSTDCPPLIVCTALGDLRIEDVEAMIEDWHRVYARKERFVALVDLRAAKGMLSAKYRARVAGLTKSVEHLSVRYSLGSAFILSNSIARGAMIAVHWLHRPQVPLGYFGTVIEGCDWCIERLREAGIAITASIEAYRASLMAKSRSTSG